MPDAPALRAEVHYLAEQLFGSNVERSTRFTDRLLEIFDQAQGRDFLLVHNPGGWGNTRIEHCLQWERSIVDGVRVTLDKLGYSSLLVQHFRSGYGFREVLWDIKEQFRFFAFKARVMAAELTFITRHVDNIKVIVVGASQGAAFGNAVMQKLNGLRQVYSIELGIVFLQKSRRVITDKTLAVDGNGLMPDAMLEWDARTVVKAFSAAPFRWLKYWLKGKPVKFSYCINVPGHEYNWEHPEVRRQIEDFLVMNFGRA